MTEPTRESPLHNLCCACGVITPDALWTAWVRKYQLDEAYDGDSEEMEWRPAPEGWSDPMLKCPACGWEHVDDDSNPGMSVGTLRELEDERRRLVEERDERYGADHAQFWSDRWEEVVGAR